MVIFPISLVPCHFLSLSHSTAQDFTDFWLGLKECCIFKIKQKVIIHQAYPENKKGNFDRRIDQWTKHGVAGQLFIHKICT